MRMPDLLFLDALAVGRQTPLERRGRRFAGAALPRRRPVGAREETGTDLSMCRGCRQCNAARSKQFRRAGFDTCRLLLYGAFGRLVGVVEEEGWTYPASLPSPSEQEVLML